MLFHSYSYLQANLFMNISYILYHTSELLLMDITSQEQQHYPQITNGLTLSSKLAQMQDAFNP